MKVKRLAKELAQEIAELPIIDAHEHLPTEDEYLAHRYSGPNLFAGGYIWHDLESAGMDPAFKATLREGGDRPVDSWWPRIAPYWRNVRYTSYARALRITVRDLWGIRKINNATIHDIADHVRTDNTPGLYARIMAKCHAEMAITYVDQATFPHDPLLRGITTLEKVSAFTLSGIDTLGQRWGQPVRSLDDAIEAVQSLLRADAARGAVGFKMISAHHAPPNLQKASEQLQTIQSGVLNTDTSALRDALFDRALDVAAELDLPVAIHTGYWGDFRENDAKHLLSFALRRRDVRFDMFHLGMPMIRDAILIGKSLPNVTINLTWCPVISQLQTARALDEILDMVPLNKVIAFGGDYRVAVQKSYGHLVLAREAIAGALARAVKAGSFGHSEALRIARMWFYENPVRVYGLHPADQVSGAE